MVLTRTPCRAHCSASSRVRPTHAVLGGHVRRLAVGAELPTWPCTEPMLMIDPPPARSCGGRQERQDEAGVEVHARSTARKWSMSGVLGPASGASLMPALLTSDVDAARSGRPRRRHERAGTRRRRPGRSARGRRVGSLARPGRRGARAGGRPAATTAAGGRQHPAEAGAEARSTAPVTMDHPAVETEGANGSSGSTAAQATAGAAAPPARDPRHPAGDGSRRRGRHG